MTQTHFQFAYDGPALVDHQIDVHHLAPALLALGEICRGANSLLNGEDSAANVYVKSDFENRCFLVNLEIQISLGQAGNLLANSYATNAKELLEWVLLAIGYWQVVKGRAAKSKTVLTDGDDKGKVSIEFQDGSTAIFAESATIIGDNLGIRRSGEKLFEPLRHEGFSEAVFTDENKNESKFNKDAAVDILKTCGPEGVEPIEPQEIVAWIGVYSPKMDDQARTWQFIWDDAVKTVEISKTSLGSDALREGVYQGDRYKVRLEISQGRDGRNVYKILEVLEAKKAPRQMSLSS